MHALPYDDGRFDAISSGRRAHHRAVDPARALRECRRCLRPGGVVVVNVPAYEWLRGAHDVPIHSARRYTRRELVAETEGAGLATVKATYWNTLLFPLMVLRRKLFGGGSDVHAYPVLVDRFFQAAIATERALLAWDPRPSVDRSSSSGSAVTDIAVAVVSAVQALRDEILGSGKSPGTRELS